MIWVFLMGLVLCLWSGHPEFAGLGLIIGACLSHTEVTIAKDDEQ